MCMCKSLHHQIWKRITCFVKLILLLLFVSTAIDLCFFYTAGFVVNPMNRWVFVFVLKPPHDYYVPEKILQLEKGKKVYEFEYRHRYSGPHMISLNIVNQNGYKEGFFNFSGNGIEIEVVVSHQSMPTLKQSWRCHKKIHYMGTPICLPILKYENKGDFHDNDLYRVELKIVGPIDELIHLHPGSYLSVRNVTNK